MTHRIPGIFRPIVPGRRTGFQVHAPHGTPADAVANLERLAMAMCEGTEDERESAHVAAVAACHSHDAEIRWGLS